MSFTAADLAALDRAIAAGELECRVDDKLIKFDDAEGLMRRRQFIAAQIAAAENAPRIASPRYQLANFSDDGVA